MQKLFDASVDYPLALHAANEEFPRAQPTGSDAANLGNNDGTGWSAYDIWHSRIRLLPGVISIFLPRR
jgi:hypothetical protein